MIKIGITGGIGCGKSMVSQLFGVLGIPVYDSDREAKRLMARSSLIRSKLLGLLGEESYTGPQLNRAYIARQVFNDCQLLEKLNAIVHPVVFSDFAHWCQSHADCLVVACESAIMYECGLDGFMNRVVLVDAPRERCIERVLSRSNVTREEVEERMNNQQPPEEKLLRADFVIRNDDVQPLIPQVLSILSQIRE